MTEGTPFADVGAPDYNVLETLDKEVEENPFWSNFWVYSPILFCYAADADKHVSKERDHCITGQILKTLTILKILEPWIQSGTASEFDLFEYTHATKVLEDKIDISEALKSPGGNPQIVWIRIKGTDKVLKVDVGKLARATRFFYTDGRPEEKKHETLELTDEEWKNLDSLCEGV